MSARGMLMDEEEHESNHESQSVASEDDIVMVGGRGRKERGRGRRRGRESLAAGKKLGVEELKRQSEEIKRDKENLHVKRVSAYDFSLITIRVKMSYCVKTLINNEITEITHKIEALDKIREKLEQDLLKLQEDDLELDDERKSYRCTRCRYYLPDHSRRCP